MRLAVFAVVVFFVIVAVGSVVAMAFLEEADGADAWDDEVEL